MKHPRLDGRTVLITGGTRGIGKETAVALAALGASVLITGRDGQRGRDSVDEISGRARSPRVELLTADLADLGRVRRLAADVRERTDRLHVLVNNAGVAVPRREVTVDGLERTFAVNYAAPFLLTSLLTDLLVASAPGRVVNVASVSQRFGRIALDDLQLSRGWTGPRANSQSKLAVVLFTYELARRLVGTGVTANALEPGWVATDLTAGRTGGGLDVLSRLARPFMATPTRGAQASVHLSADPDLAEVTGRYFTHRLRPARTARASYDTVLAGDLWRATESLVGSG